LEFVNSDCWFVQFAEGVREAKKGRRSERRWLGARPVYVVWRKQAARRLAPILRRYRCDRGVDFSVTVAAQEQASRHASRQTYRDEKRDRVLFRTDFRKLSTP
jgi:hypothetical protein